MTERLAENGAMNNELREAVDALVRAINDEGPAPDFHHKVMARHRKEWPTLWAAIDRIRETRGDD